MLGKVKMKKRIILIEQKKNMKRWMDLLDTIYLLDRDLYKFVVENIFDVDDSELNNLSLKSVDFER